MKKGTVLLLLLISSISMLINCKTKKIISHASTTTLNKQTVIDSIAKKHFGQSYTITPNATDELVLIEKRTIVRKGDSFPNIHFLVLDTESWQTLHEERLVRSQLRWKTANSLEVLRVPGVMKRGDKRERRIITLRQ